MGCNDGGDLEVSQGHPERGPGAELRLLVAVDTPEGSSAEGLVRAALLGQATDATLRLIHVRPWDPPIRGYGRFYLESSEQATSLVEAALEQLWEQNLRASGVVVDAPRSGIALTIAEEAKSWEADMIVVAYRPKGPVGSLITGAPLAQQVIREAFCSVLVVPCVAFPGSPG
jgi:nucleotide-binding universal stress UspA family protein